MPTTSPAQHRLMEAVAHDPAVSKKTGIPQSVGREMVAKDSAGGKCVCGQYMDAVSKGDAEAMHRISKNFGAK